MGEWGVGVGRKGGGRWEKIPPPVRPLIEGDPCTKFGTDEMNRSRDIEWTTLGLQTDRPTVEKQYAPFFMGGI